MKFNMGIIVAGVGALVLLAAFMGKPKSNQQLTQPRYIFDV